MSILNLAGMTRAPEWRVSMERKRSLNAVQNARTKAVYVIAPDEPSAKRLAVIKNPEFVAVSARRAA
jgi:hypothetical protein